MTKRVTTNWRVSAPSPPGRSAGAVLLATLLSLVMGIESAGATEAPLVVVSAQHTDCKGDLVETLVAEMRQRLSHPVRIVSGSSEMPVESTEQGWTIKLASSGRGRCRIEFRSGGRGETTDVGTVASSKLLDVVPMTTRIAWLVDSSAPSRLRPSVADETSKRMEARETRSETDASISGPRFSIAPSVGATLSPSNGRLKGLLGLRVGAEFAGGVLFEAVGRMPVGRYAYESESVEALDSVRWRFWSIGLSGGYHVQLGRSWTLTPSAGIRRTWSSLSADFDEVETEEVEESEDSERSSPPRVRPPGELAHWSVVGRVDVARKLTPELAVRLGASVGGALAPRRWMVGNAAIGRMGRLDLDVTGGMKWTF